MENNKLIKRETDLLKRVSNAMSLTQKLLSDKTQKNPEEHNSLPPRMYLNDFHKESSEKSQREVNEMMKNPLTVEQMKEQIARLSEGAEEEFLKQAPEIQKIAASMKTPLRIREIASIYRWLGRKQITLDMLPLDVLEEFKQRRQYQTHLRKH